MSDQPVHMTPPRGRSGRAVVVLLVLAALAIVAVAAFLLTRGGDDDDSDDTAGSTTRTPEETVEGYFDAIEDGDCEKLIDYVSERNWSSGGSVDRSEAIANCNDTADEGQLGGMTLGDVGDAVVDGDTATVEVSGTYEGEPIDERFQLVREAGEWKVDLGS